MRNQRPKAESKEQAQKTTEHLRTPDPRHPDQGRKEHGRGWPATGENSPESSKPAGPRKGQPVGNHLQIQAGLQTAAQTNTKAVNPAQDHNLARNYK